MFVPMEKPAAIRLPDVFEQRKLAAMPPMKETLRDENCEYDVEALGHLLFQCPATIETFVDHWLSHDQTQSESPNDTLLNFLMSLANQNPVLQITSRVVVNALGRRESYSHDINFLTNFRHENGNHDYEVSDKLLIALAGPAAEKLPALYQIRLSFLLTGFLCHNEGKNFTQHRPNTSKTSATFAGFRYDKILAETYDRSAYVVAMVCALTRYCDVMMRGEVTEGPRSVEKLAREESAYEIFAILDTFIREIRHRSSRLSSVLTNDIPDALCCYSHGVHNEDTILFGIPAQVVASDVWTLLWLEWAWKSEIWRQAPSTSFDPEKPAKDDVSTTVIGLSRILQDVWRAKSLLLYHNYYEFFVQWDAERLMPSIQRFEAAKQS